jgi:hypothetical protein
MRILAPLLLLAAIAASCSQSLPPTVVPSSAIPTDFFWTTTQLDSGLDYYVIRQSVGADHPISSSDGIHVDDGSLNKTAFRMRSLGDTVAIDSIGTSSIFSLPQGFYFAGDTENQAGELALLERSGLHLGGSWAAGTLAGPGLGQGVAITATVLDSVDALSLLAIGPVPPSEFGQSYRVRYSHDSANGVMSPTLPFYWTVYYTRQLGPVLIEEYLDSLGTQSLESQAVLRSKNK